MALAGPVGAAPRPPAAVLRPAGAELLTRDPKGNTIDKTLTIDAYVCWRIAGPGGRGSVHAHASGTPEGRRPSSASASPASWGPPSARWSWTTSISTDAGRVDAAREALRARLLDKRPAAAAAASRRGRVRHRGGGRPAAPLQPSRRRCARRSSTASAASGNKKAAEYQSEGERLAADISSASERRGGAR